MATSNGSNDEIFVSEDAWNDSDAEGMSSFEEEIFDRQFDGSSSEEDLPPEKTNIANQDDGNSCGSEEAGCPPTKRAMKGLLSASRGSGTSSKGRGRSGTQTSGPADNVNSNKETPHVGYDFPDEVCPPPAFTPRRPTGVHLEGPDLRGTMTTELEFFHLFFTPEVISEVVKHTNSYARLKIGTKRCSRVYVNEDGSWNDTSNEEIERFIALLIYFGLVGVCGDVAKYWSTKSLFDGLWARRILSHDRYQALSAFLHVVEPADESPGQKLRKVNEFLASFKERCKILYQPSQKLAVDERMFRSKHSSNVKQAMKDKPMKQGLKLWILVDSDNGYTVDFNVYIGKGAAKVSSEHGLSYDAAMELMRPFLNQGYHLYLDNFYTSPQLVRDLFEHGTLSTGTVKTSRKGFPACLTDVEKWAKKAKKGDIRWIRLANVLALQWMDRRPVSILTTLYSANDQVSCERMVKMARGRFTDASVPQPLAIREYIQSMSGVDRPDQMLACRSLKRKCYKWWKTLFIHLVDIAVVNSFLLFQNYRAQKPDVEALQRSAEYSVMDFREALVRQILHFEEYDDPPVDEKRAPCESQFAEVHIPEFSEFPSNCVVCYQQGRGEKKVSSFCSAPQCQKFMHILQPDLNCFQTWHSPHYHRR